MVDNSKKFIELREKYKKIIYDKYIVTDSKDSISISYHYIIDALSDFYSIWKIDKVNKDIRYSSKKLDSLAFSLGMVELISYYKITCPESIEISCHALSDTEISWWKKLYIRGLSEFSYTNNIVLDDYSMTFTSTSDKKYEMAKEKNVLSSKNVLIPIGGGKDSAVSIEVLKKDIDRYCYIINPRKATLDTFKASNIDENKLIVAIRTFDEKIIKYNYEGFLNGHTPFSAIVAFSSVIAAYVNGIKYVALSNESSANESTVKDSYVNHQYSKTFEFECDFRNYEKKYIDTGVNYFSLLRPLTEVGIAKIFSSFSKYHEIFRSCNVGSKNDIWCASCAKCLFVYIILSPFISEDKLTHIFGKNMLDDMNLKDIFDKLIGVIPEKPFECVGSRDEVNACMQYLSKRRVSNNEPKLITYYKKLNIPKVNDLDIFCKSYDEKNNLPEFFDNILRKQCIILKI